MNSVKINRHLEVERSIFDFLNSSGNIISNIIINGETERGINYITPSDKGLDFVEFLPDSKFKDGEDPWTQKGRITMKIGKLPTKLVPERYFHYYEITSSQIEDFVNTYKSWFDKSNLEFSIVEGEDIRKWYLEYNYFSPNHNQVGSLWNSCMRQSKKQPFLDMYCKNPNVKMLILTTNVNGKKLLRARALLWDNVKVIQPSEEIPENIKVMDRIYSVFDCDVITFKKWAEENGYIPKWQQNSKSHQFFDIKNQVTRIRCQINLDFTDLNYYPYLDTFPFFNERMKFLSNDEFNTNWKYKLVQANGQPEREMPVEDDVFVTEDDDHDW